MQDIVVCGDICNHSTQEEEGVLKSLSLGFTTISQMAFNFSCPLFPSLPHLTIPL